MNALQGLERKKPLIFIKGFGSWRRRRDSNPRYRFKPICFLSREVPSTTRPRLHTCTTFTTAAARVQHNNFACLSGQPRQALKVDLITLFQIECLMKRAHSELH